MFRSWRYFFLILIPAILVQQVFAIRPSVIYGDDDRLDYYQADVGARQFANSTVALMRTGNLEANGATTRIKTSSYGQGMGLCTNEPFYSQETAAFCSGFLVKPDVIVTAGHCIRSEISCQSTKFVFGFRLENEGSQPREVATENIYSCQQLIHSVAQPDGEDFAVIRLDRPVTQATPLSWRKEGRIETGAGLTVIGHPSGLPTKIAGGASVRTLKPQYLIANLDTYGGNSGSVVLNASTGLVEGVLVRGELDFTYKDGCRMSNRCGNDSCRGEDVTLIERVLPYIR